MKNRFKIFDSITSHVLEEFVEFVDKSKSKNLEILIHSFGGSGEAMAGIIDYMKSSKKKFTTIGLGRVESAALSIFLSGDVKKAYKQTTFFSHKTQVDNGSVWSNFKYRKKRAIYQSLIEDTIAPLKATKDTYYTAKELLDLKLIDEII